MEMLRVHKHLLHLDEKMRKLKDPSSREKAKKTKIEENEVEMKAALSKLKVVQESLRKAMENMAKEKSVKNVDLSNKMEVDTHQINSEEIRMLIKQIEDKNDDSFYPDQFAMNSNCSTQKRVFSEIQHLEYVAEDSNSSHKDYGKRKRESCLEDDDLLNEILGDLAKGTKLVQPSLDHGRHSQGHSSQM